MHMLLPSSLPPAAAVRVWSAHTHQHVVTRRWVIQGGAVIAGGVVAGAALGAGPASAAGDKFRNRAAEPRPIPGGIQPFGPGTETFHVFLPGAGDPSTITDFDGVVGIADVQGVGTGANARSAFDADMRFMRGRYVGLDGRRHHGTFGFV
jgi:hypothetical protein